MAYLDGRRSEFPDKMDNLLELFNLPASLKPNAKRYKQLLTKETLSTMEKSEFNDLKVLLQDYLIDVQKFNLFGDILINMQKFFKEGVEPFVNELKDNATKEIKDRKDEVIDYMDSTTAGAIRSDIGVVKDLDTKNKDSLVGAVNEIRENGVNLDDKIDRQESKINILNGDGMIKEKADKKTLNEHISANNPHNVTKSTIELNNVQNYSVATKSDAEDGVSNAKYMTPLRVKNALEFFNPKKTLELFSYGYVDGVDFIKGYSTDSNYYTVSNDGLLTIHAKEGDVSTSYSSTVTQSKISLNNWKYVIVELKQEERIGNTDVYLQAKNSSDSGIYDYSSSSSLSLPGDNAYTNLITNISTLSGDYYIGIIIKNVKFIPVDISIRRIYLSNTIPENI